MQRIFPLANSKMILHEVSSLLLLASLLILPTHALPGAFRMSIEFVRDNPLDASIVDVSGPIQSGIFFVGDELELVGPHTNEIVRVEGLGPDRFGNSVIDHAYAGESVVVSLSSNSTDLRGRVRVGQVLADIGSFRFDDHFSVAVAYHGNLELEEGSELNVAMLGSTDVQGQVISIEDLSDHQDGELHTAVVEVGLSVPTNMDGMVELSLMDAGTNPLVVGQSFTDFITIGLCDPYPYYNPYYPPCPRYEPHYPSYPHYGPGP